MPTQYTYAYVLVDDDDDERYLMRAALEDGDRPLPIREFRSGEEVLDYLQVNRESRDDSDVHWLIALDANLPRQSGLETIRAIRANAEWADLPIVLFSGTDDQNLIQEALRSGANGFAAKPHSVEGYRRVFDEHFAPWLSRQDD